MSILIRLMQSKFKNKVQQSKWYAKVVSTGEIHTDELATIIESNTTFKKGEVQGLITELVDELKQQLSDGKTVVLDGFGRFHLTVESDLVAQQTDFNIHQHIRRIKCKFYQPAIDWHIRVLFSKISVKMWRWNGFREKPKGTHRACLLVFFCG